MRRGRKRRRADKHREGDSGMKILVLAGGLSPERDVSLSSGSLIANALIEIIPKSGFYDYQNKYQKGASEEICPADLDEATAQALQKAALRVHEILQLGSYSRVDFIRDARGDNYCLEANTLPGMTPTSLLPQEAAAAGIPYEALCERIVRAVERSGHGQ